jgi:hypothetical protein
MVPDVKSNGHSSSLSPALLDQVADAAYLKLGPLDGRLAKAVALVRNGDVRLLPQGYAEVRSQSQPTHSYSVNGSCTCEDAKHGAPEGKCKHLVAAWIARKVAALSHKDLCATATPDLESGGQASGPLALPEAPASVNCHITIAGRQVQITLRDTDETRLVQRLTALLSQYPLPEKAEASSAPARQPEEWCPVHQVQTRQTSKDGRSWYSHKTEEGWCKGK